MKRTLPAAVLSLLVIPAAVALLATRLGASLRAEVPALPAPTVVTPHAAAPSVDTAVFAGGCFWGIEAVFEHVKGVQSATSGYAGGSVASPSYEQVSSGDTGHAESV